MRLALRRWPDPPAADRPPLLLVHGLTASSGTWWRIGPDLAAAGWQVLAPDLRCHGASGCDGAIGRWDAADDLAEIVDAEAGGRLDVAWGHSLGARTILQLLGRRPGIAARLVLEDPPGLRGDRGDQIAGWRREAALARTQPAMLAEEVRGRNPDWDERDVAGVVRDVADCRIEPIIDAIERGAAMVDPAEALVAAIRTPALLLLAEEERSGLTGASRAATIAALPPGSRTVEMGTGHSIHRDAPDDYLAIALEWLGGPQRTGAEILPPGI
jgi:pimeloyl-ACP methyl ester carboxylesterase